MESNNNNVNLYYDSYPDYNENPENEGGSNDVIAYPPKKAYSRSGFAILAFVLLFNLLVVVGSVILALINGTETVTVTEALIVNLIVEAGIAFPIYYFLMKKIPAGVPERKNMGAGSFLSAVSIMYCISIIGSLISSAVNGFLSNTVDEVSTADLEILFENNFVFTAVYCVIVAPVVEELVFRKLLVDRLQSYSKKMAIIISGLSFGLMHGNLEQFFYTFFLGCFFAFIYTMTGKIRYTIGLHFIMNGVSVLLSYFMTKITIFNEDLENMTDTVLLEKLLGDETQLIAFMFMGLIAFAEYVFAFIGLVKLISKRGSFTVDDSKRTITAKEAFINPGIIISFGVMIALIVVDLFA